MTLLKSILFLFCYQLIKQHDFHIFGFFLSLSTTNTSKLCKNQEGISSKKSVVVFIFLLNSIRIEFMTYIFFYVPFYKFIYIINICTIRVLKRNKNMSNDNYNYINYTTRRDIIL